MDFGALPIDELEQVDFRLPKDPVFNQEVLPGKKAVNPKIYIGCSKWGRAEWVGKLYPSKTRERFFLDHYVKHFNSIELNATHYKIIGPLGIKKWADKAGDRDFLFCPKMHQGITHKGKFGTKPFLLNEFLRGIVAFGKHLGPVFIQFNDRFVPKRKEDLFHLLQSLPQDIQFFLELRHKDWFGKKEIREELFSTLRTMNIGAVITDTAGRRDCVHMHLPIPKVFIRYAGNDLHPTDYTRIDAWVEKIEKWIKKGIQEVYFFMHMREEVNSPEMISYMIDKINKIPGVNLPKPQFIGNNES